jgi:hypothetical protein
MHDGSLRLTFLLGGLAMLGPFATDTYFPSFPAISHFLQMLIFAVISGAVAPALFGSAFKLAAGASAGLGLAAVFWSLGTRNEMVHTAVAG